jgi:Mce-associated membrane protein
VDADRPDSPAVTGARRRLPGALLGLALVVPVAASIGVWQWQGAELEAAEESRALDREALDAATRQTLAWASVDYREADEYVETVEAGATGEFLKQFQESEDALRALLRSNESVQVPDIPEGGAGLVERDGDQARVLIAMDASVTNKEARTPQPRQYRLQVTLTRSGGDWLTSGMEFIDAQT